MFSLKMFEKFSTKKHPNPLVPQTALARLPSSVGSKVIWDQNNVLAESDESERHFHYVNEGSFASFQFGRSELSVYTDRNPIKRFVVESPTLGPDERRKDYDCKNQSSLSMRSFILYCEGVVRVRELTKKESEQMQEFINRPEGRPFRTLKFNQFMTRFRKLLSLRI